jgi:protein SCO1/2
MRLLVIFILACSSRPAPIESVETPVPTEQVSTAPSLYYLGISGLDSARGHRVVLTMFYGSCAVACPAVIDHIKRVVGTRDVRVLLVSFDATRDTPARLAELVRTHGLDARWTLLAPTENDARELAASIGFRYRKLASGEYYHGSTIVVLDEAGRTITKTDGFGQGEQLLAALR